MPRPESGAPVICGCRCHDTLPALAGSQARAHLRIRVTDCPPLHDPRAALMACDRCFPTHAGAPGQRWALCYTAPARVRFPAS